MEAGNALAARRSWMNAEARADAIRIAQQPTLGQIFKQGFMRGSMLQMAVCAPPRQAATHEYEAVFVTSLGEKTVAKGRPAETVEA